MTYLDEAKKLYPFIIKEAERHLFITLKEKGWFIKELNTVSADRDNEFFGVTGYIFSGEFVSVTFEITRGIEHNLNWDKSKPNIEIY